MKKGFTIVEVSILFVIFLIVAFLVAPLSLNDNMQAKNTSRWINVQNDFENLFYSIDAKAEENEEDISFEDAFDSVMKTQIKAVEQPYKITYMNGSFPNGEYRFTDFNQTNSNAVVSYRIYNSPESGPLGIMMYDVNGAIGPNVWGKDIFGYNIYDDRLEPFCKNETISVQKQDCSKSGTGLCCSNYYLIGGKFN